MILAPQQIQALNEITAWYKDKSRKRYVLGGYAGTGKTVLARHISDMLGNVIFCAYTGKAASVLRERGIVNAGTIHSYLYVLEKTEDGKPKFRRATRFECQLSNASLVVVDEFSMLPQSIIEDIEIMAKKVLYLGDPFQLPPVYGECPLETDFVLTEIHRQALDSPVLRAATDVREGKRLSHCDNGDFKYLPRNKVSENDFLNADQVIVGRNDTRRVFNAWARRRRGYDGILPQCDEKLMCLKNNAEIGIFNGQIDIVQMDAEKITSNAYSLCWGGLDNIEVWMGDIRGGDEKYIWNRNKPLERFDYCYAATAHKLQGSEFNSALIINQPIGKDHVERSRWLYTALTRCKKTAILTDSK